MDTFSERLKHVRAQLSITQSYVADLIGVTSGHITHLERGTKEPSPLIVRALARELGIHEEWLMHGEGPIFESVEQIIEREIDRFGLEAVLNATQKIAKAEGLEVPLPRPATNEPVQIANFELRQMLEYLTNLWFQADPRIKAWVTVQFERAFPDFKLADQKKPGNTSASPDSRSALSS